VTPDLDTLLTALYVLIDDHVIPSGQWRPGRPKKLSDAELACLAVAHGGDVEQAWDFGLDRILAAVRCTGGAA
jgi:hypothetical protein